MRVYRLLLVLGILAVFILQIAANVPAHAQSPPSAASRSCSAGNDYVASLNADIDPGAADFMSTTVSNAESASACTIVFVLQTNGGDGGSMESMVGSIESYQQWGGTFITLVAPIGGYAFSAGAYIAEASTKIYMVPGTTIGSATPIVSGIPTGEENSTMTKDIDAFTSYMQTLTGSNGRNATSAGMMVNHGVSYSCKSYADCQALQVGVVNGVLNATTKSGALAALNVPAGTATNTPGIRSQLISVLTDPDVSSLLFLIGIFVVLFDIYHPTIVLSVVGIAMMALALFGLGDFGAPLVSIILMIVAAAFIFLEVKTQHGISALVGVVIFVIGFLLIFSPPAPAAASSPAQPAGNFFTVPAVSYALIAIIAAVGIIGSLYLAKIRKQLQAQPSQFDKGRMIGREGRMESDLKAGGLGVAMIGSEEWTVTSSEAIAKGSLVKVKEVTGNHLTVEKIQG
ncbi:MAG TPA: NfeD family protein [Nitrososphaerales archaeon]|nr:NfeD family protein [Nitrososphaerales archaeon]